MNIVNVYYKTISKIKNVEEPVIGHIGKTKIFFVNSKVTIFDRLPYYY